MYRHITNLYLPIDAVDADFLWELGDYRIGAPVKGRAESAREVSDMASDGVIGIYTTDAAIASPAVKAKLGAGQPVLGDAWVPMGAS